MDRPPNETQHRTHRPLHNNRQARAEAAAAVARGEAAAVRVVAAIVGDFLAPSLLSCLDQGRGTWYMWYM